MSDIEKISDLIIQIEKIKLQLGRIESHIDSESGTLSRETKRLRDSISKVEVELKDIVYHHETGLLIKIDRLVQDNDKRKKMEAHIVVLWIMVLAGLLKEVIIYFVNKN